MLTDARREEVRKAVAQLQSAKEAVERVAHAEYLEYLKLTAEEWKAKTDSEEEDFSSADIDGAIDDIQNAILKLESAAEYTGGNYYKCCKEG